MSQEEIRVRIAPSPTGEAHVGTAYVALFNKVFAHKNGGKFILRIEDTDQTRSRKEYAQQIFDALSWLNISYDEGPDIGGPYGPYLQSERLSIYKKHVEILIEKEAAYYCFCTSERLDKLRKEQEQEKAEIRGYDGHCRELSRNEAFRRVAQGEAHVVRLKVEKEGETQVYDLLRPEQKAFANKEIDDQVLLKADGFPTYHLANVVDDHLMKITHVIRAEEWITSTPKHVLLYQAFGWECPKFAHLNLLRNKDKSKISKRKNPTSLLYYKSEGYIPEALLNFLANHSFTFPEKDPKTGENREIFSLAEMQSHFDFKHLQTGAPVFDLDKLKWMNGEYLMKLLEASEVKRRLLKYFDERLDAILPELHPRMRLLSDAFHEGNFYFSPKLDYPATLLIPKKKTIEEVILILKELHKLIVGTKKKAGLAKWEVKLLEGVVREFCETQKWDSKDLFMVLRVVITGKKSSPALFNCMELVGKRHTIERIDFAVEILEKEKRASSQKASK